MAYQVRKGSDDVGAALVAGYNALRQTVALSGSMYHRDVTSTTSGFGDSLATTAYTVTAVNGDGTLAKLKLLCADLALKYKVHIADATAHLVADATNTLASYATPADLTAAIAFVNDFKAKFNAHLSQSGVHVNNDSNTVATADASTTQAQADTLANALKAAFNIHVQSAPKGASITLVSP